MATGSGSPVSVSMVVTVGASTGHQPKSPPSDGSPPSSSAPRSSASRATVGEALVSSSCTSAADTTAATRLVPA